MLNKIPNISFEGLCYVKMWCWLLGPNWALKSFLDPPNFCNTNTIATPSYALMQPNNRLRCELFYCLHQVTMIAVTSSLQLKSQVFEPFLF